MIATQRGEAVRIERRGRSARAAGRAGRRVQPSHLAAGAPSRRQLPAPLHRTHGRGAAVHGPGGVGHDEQLLWLIPLAVVALALVKGFAGYWQSVLMTTVGQRIVADIQLALFARLMRADLAYFHANPTGSLISRFTNDATMLRGATTTVLAGIGKEAVTAAFLIALMFYQDWVL